MKKAEREKQKAEDFIQAAIRKARLKQWTNPDGVKWECDEYDHGPFCRLCRRVDE